MMQQYQERLKGSRGALQSMGPLAGVQSTGQVTYRITITLLRVPLLAVPSLGPRVLKLHRHDKVKRPCSRSAHNHSATHTASLRT